MQSTIAVRRLCAYAVLISAAVRLNGMAVHWRLSWSMNSSARFLSSHSNTGIHQRPKTMPPLAIRVSWSMALCMVQRLPFLVGGLFAVWKLESYRWGAFPVQINLQ